MRSLRGVIMQHPDAMALRFAYADAATGRLVSYDQNASICERAIDERLAERADATPGGAPNTGLELDSDRMAKPCDRPSVGAG